jgi:hypothetical protein
MSTELQDIVTSTGDISVLDRTGGTITFTLDDDLGDDVDISSWDLWFEIGTIQIALTPDGTDQLIVISPEDIEIIAAERANRFALINKTDDQHVLLWEGNFFIRSVN